MTTISGVSFNETWEDRLSGELFEVPVEFLGLESFTRNKRSTGRPKDLEDLRSLGQRPAPDDNR